MKAVLVLGNQLFNPKEYQKYQVTPSETVFFLREDYELATYYRFHKHKIILFFSAMRSYREELRSHGYQVHYEELSSPHRGSYEDSLAQFLKSQKILHLFCFEIEDQFFEKRIHELAQKLGITFTVWPSPMFLTSRNLFKDYLKVHQKPQMRTFYIAQRKRFNILIEKTKPIGGAWSFDTKNRLSLPVSKMPPPLIEPKKNRFIQETIALVNQIFPLHPGEGHTFWLPVDRKGAQDWLKDFISKRLNDFGPYEDALPAHSDFVYHSVLSPLLNLGLLTPAEVIAAVLEAHQRKDIPLASLEGFIRQVIGWREFIRGIYQNFNTFQEQKNFWGHHHRLKNIWYQGNTGIPPLDWTLKRILQRGYAHHIERLMVLGNLMLLLEVEPKEAYRWFMEMFVDSSDWVMGPNVFGMALFSDGGIFATKPYLCGSNYLRKMSGEKMGAWCLGIDGLYWSFIKKHREYFSKNPRLSMMVRAADRISKEKWLQFNTAADQIRNQLVDAPSASQSS